MAWVIVILLASRKDTLPSLFNAEFRESASLLLNTAGNNCFSSLSLHYIFHFPVSSTYYLSKYTLFSHYALQNWYPHFPCFSNTVGKLLCALTIKTSNWEDWEIEIPVETTTLELTFKKLSIFISWTIGENFGTDLFGWARNEQSQKINGVRAWNTVDIN